MGNENAKRQPGAGTKAAAETVYTRMGRLLGRPIRSEADAWRVAKEGISAKQYVMLAERWSLAPTAVGSESTIRRRIRLLNVTEGEKRGRKRKMRDARNAHAIEIIKAAAAVAEPRLTPNESERLMRLARVVSEATLLFGDEQTALNWLNTPADFLHDEKPLTPMKLAETDSGARMVESMIFRTSHGFF